MAEKDRHKEVPPKTQYQATDVKRPEIVITTTGEDQKEEELPRTEENTVSAHGSLSAVGMVGMDIDSVMKDSE